MKVESAKIVSAYLRNNRVNSDQIPGLIQQVYSSLSGLGQPVVVPEAPRTPAVPIRRSVGDDIITCLDCGFKGKMLKRHLLTAHGLTPDDYRKRWNLPTDYPVVARNYAAQR